MNRRVDEIDCLQPIKVDDTMPGQGLFLCSYGSWSMLKHNACEFHRHASSCHRKATQRNIWFSEGKVNCWFWKITLRTSQTPLEGFHATYFIYWKKPSTTQNHPSVKCKSLSFFLVVLNVFLHQQKPGLCPIIGGQWFLAKIVFVFRVFSETFNRPWAMAHSKGNTWDINPPVGILPA